MDTPPPPAFPPKDARYYRPVSLSVMQPKPSVA
jgi:hypothetical protein